MKVLVTGATGFVGKKLCRRLLLEGHSLVLVSRKPDRAEKDLEFPGAYFPSPPPERAFEGVDAVVNLAGENVGEGRWTEAKKHAIYQSRIEGTRALVESFPPTHLPKVFVSASAIGFYGDAGPRIVDETATAGTGFLAQVCLEWEKAAAAAPPSVRVAIPRIGVVLGTESGMLAKLLPVFRMGLGGPVGNGRQYIPWIHVEDLISILMQAITDERYRGPFNATAPEPATNAEFTAALAHTVGRPAIFRVPKLALKLALGEMAGLVLSSTRALPKRLMAWGFHFRHPELVGALADLVPRAPYQELVFEQYLPRKVDEIFPFFSSEKNLERITPPWLRFRVVGKSTPKVEAGTLIDYRLRIRGVPVRWQSRIEDLTENESFTDTQVKGPYASWHHLHRFLPMGEGTFIVDRVRYRVPFGAIGRWLLGRWIRRDVRRIFEHRRRQIHQIFG